MLALVWALVILILSVVPGETLPKVGWRAVIHFDKIAHAVVYAILALAMSWSIMKRKQFSIKTAAVIVLICSLYGILLEMVQHSFLSDRFFEIPDIIANIIGSIIGAGFVFFITNKNQRL